MANKPRENIHDRFCVIGNGISKPVVLLIPAHHTCTCMYMYMYMYIYVYMYIHMHVYMLHVHVYVYVYEYIYCCNFLVYFVKFCWDRTFVCHGSRSIVICQMVIKVRDSENGRFRGPNRDAWSKELWIEIKNGKDKKIPTKWFSDKKCSDSK